MCIRDRNKVTWSIGRIEMNERIEVVYEIQGDTEAEYKVSDAQDFHGATFGKEVDEVPNVPEWAESVVDTPLITLPLSKPINDVEVSIQHSNDHKEPNNDSEDYDLNLEQDSNGIWNGVVFLPEVSVGLYETINMLSLIHI